MNEHKKEFGNAIRQLRARYGLSRVEFARRIDSTTKTISEWERHLKGARDSGLYCIKKALGLSAKETLELINARDRFYDSNSRVLSEEDYRLIHSIENDNRYGSLSNCSNDDERLIQLHKNLGVKK